MKKELLLILLLFAGMVNAQNVTIPDPAFKAKLIALGVDVNADGNIQNSEALTVTSLNLKDANIAILDGIQAFVNLTFLDCNFNLLSTLNVTALTNLVTLNAYANQITELHVEGLSHLEALNCGNNKLTTLNTTGLTNVKNLNIASNSFTSFNAGAMPNLREISMGYNPFTSFSAVSGVSANLEYLGIEGLELTSLNVTAYPNLKSLSCAANKLPSLTAVTGLTANLETLYCFSNQMTTLNATGFPNLKLLFCDNNAMTALNVVGLANLEELRCANNQLTTLDVTGLTNLKFFDFDTNQLTALNLTGMTALTDLRTFANPLSLNITGLNALESIYCSYNQIGSVNFSVLPNLTSITIYGGSGPAALNLSGASSITELNCKGLNLSSINLSGLVNLKKLVVSENNLSELDLTGLVNLEYLGCSFNHLTALDLTGLNNLKTIDCASNELTSVNTSALTQLEGLYCNSNQFTSLNLANNNNLKTLQAGYNSLTAIDVSNLSQLVDFRCESNQIATLNLINNPELVTIYANDNQISSLQLNPQTLKLRALDYSNNPLPDFDFSNYTELVRLGLANTERSSLDVTDQTKLFILNCANNPIPAIDISNNYKMTEFGCGSASLTNLFMKNGADELLTFFASPNLQFVCTDDVQTQSVQNIISASGNTSAVVNSYCSFIPGGNYNTITGNMIFDANNNGCEASDFQQPNIKININDGTTTGSTFTNTTGIYSFYTLTGNFAVTPQVENSSYFNFSPSTATVPFLNNDNNTANQSFCITANGIHPDLEVVVAPIGRARPGFDATYKVIFKNNGNQTLSGNVTFGFDDSVLDFISSTEIPASVSTNLLLWNYNSLLPFESRSYTVILNVNSPLETPPVNLNQLLTFNANITPENNDVSPDNNQFELVHVVTGSFDPNDIACLEGDSVAPEEIGSYLHYIVNFENTGTAEAENVVVKVEIDTEKYDINTLQLLDASDESYSILSGNVLEFKFPNINLAPLAGDPPVGGHGSILFKMKTKASLNSGDFVENTANIYFDYNAPIQTNDARTTFATLTTTSFPVDQSVVIYPNPVTDFVNVSCKTEIKSFSIYDSNGRILQTEIFNQKTAKISMSDKASGIYFIKITTENGVKVQQLVKK